MNAPGKPDRLDTALSDSNKIRQRIEGLILVLALSCSAIMMLAFCVDRAYADDENGLGDVTRGSLWLHGASVEHPSAAPLLHTEVVIDVSGLIVRAKVRQEFQNNGDDWVEGIYVFPLPEDAAVDHMHMEVGMRIIEGQIRERRQAKHDYDQARQAGKKASLIEQERPNLFTNAVANIGPHEHVTIAIEYEQVLRYDAGRFTLRFPMAVTPRYVPGRPLTRFDDLGWVSDSDEVTDASRITPPVRRTEEPVNPISLTLNLNAGFPIAELESPYHAITRKNVDVGNGIVQITLSDETVFADRDFELSWKPMAGREPTAALFREQIGADGYYLLMMLPPTSDRPTVTKNGQPLAREAIYVIDTSGSMAGTSIRQAKEALLLALSRLRACDRFNVIAFNSATDQLFGDVVPADGDNLERARAYVSELSAGGGTEMYPALMAALRRRQESNGVRQIIFLTDGAVTNESALFELIHRRLGDSRLFTVGIGSAPNSHFMSKAAEFGRGGFTYIGDVNQVHTQMATLFRKLENPLMRDLKVESEDLPLEMFPRRLPDLYSSEPLVAVFKSSGDGRRLLIAGHRQEQTWRNTLQLDRGTTGKGIGVLWARRKIAALTDEQDTGSASATLERQIVDVALQHHLVSKYTSLVAIDVTPSRPEGEGLDRRALPINLPQGQVFEKIFGAQARTATSAPLNLCLGTLLLFSALLLHRREAS